MKCRKERPARSSASAWRSCSIWARLEMARVCVFGAGAIGGYLAASLAKAGADVSIVARGPHLAAIQANGLKLIKDGEETVWRIWATDDPRELGEQDYVIVGMKAHAVPAVVEQFGPLLGKATAV